MRKGDDDNKKPKQHLELLIGWLNSFRNQLPTHLPMRGTWGTFDHLSRQTDIMLHLCHIRVTIITSIHLVYSVNLQVGIMSVKFGFP